MTDEENGTNYEVSCSLGDLSLTVSGGDEDWVEETFEEKWESRLQEAADMKEAIKQNAPGHQ
jgi:hypothetical protein